ncbi:MAG: FAD-dependent oxidoreductase [Candidatus Bathyarchaeia archaeon]
MASKILIIGAGASGVSAAAAARKTDRHAEITLVTDEAYAAYSRCGLPFVLGREVPSFRDLILYKPEFYRMMRLNVMLESTAIELDPSSKRVQVENRGGGIESLDYDRLVVATGAKAARPPVKGVDKAGVYVVRTISDCEAIDTQITRSRSAVIVGAGLIGLEVAAALRQRGLKVVVVEILPQVLPMMLDPEMARIVHEHLKKNGIEVMVDKGVDEIIGDEAVSAVSVAGSRIEADMVVLATGVRPQVELLRKAGAEIGKTGCVKVDEHMRTSLDGVYAAGDCAETVDMVTGAPISPQLGTTAVRQGKTAGVNAAGGKSALPSVLGSSVTRFLGLEVGLTGMTEKRAQKFGLDVVAGTVTAKTRAHYYPGGADIKVKVVMGAETGKIVGAQIVGGEEVTQRINMASIAIQKGLTVYDANAIDTCYSPPVADYWEPFVVAIEAAARKI